MALPASGTLTLTDIQTEFGGASPIGLSEYYRGGAYTTTNNTNVPTSGAISISNFYGGTSVYTYTISSNVQEANVRSLAITSGWDGNAPLKVVINSGVYVWSNSTSTGGLIVSGSFPTGITIENSGYIIGKGGKGGRYGGQGSGYSGGPALVDSSGSLTFSNLSGGYIAGGGGGGAGGGYTSGGGGAGGGDGGGPTVNDGYGSFNGGAGGAIGQSGSNGAGVGGYTGSGGGAGGGGGSTLDRGSKTDNPSGAGGGGGRILPGTGGAGSRNSGSGGSSNNSGGSIGGGNWFSGGGGGWGASGGSSGSAGGGSGGAGGRAITWSSTQGTVTNSGLIYGAYT